MQTVLAALALGALALPAGAATLKVGPGRTYARPCQAIAAAKDGDVIEVDAGSYPGDTCAWSTDNLTVRGVGGRAAIDLTGVTPAQQKGIFTIAAPSATIENFELSGAAISAAAGLNGAGIRHQGLDLTVRGCYFHDNQDGILGAPPVAGQGTVLIEGSEFFQNGAGDGYSHNMYIGNYARFTLRASYSHQAKVGHLVKSRAFVTEVLYNRITDEATGTASYEIDLPYGGTAFLLGNLIEQGPKSQNPGIIAYGEEGFPAGYDNHLYVVNNTLLNNLKSGTFVVNMSTAPATLTNNIFWNGGAISSRAGDLLTANFDSSQGDPRFVDVTHLDAHLRSDSPCIDRGAAPGSAGGQSLLQPFEYVHPLGQRPRVTVGAAIDIGAYEYGVAPDGGAAGTPDGGAGPAPDGGGTNQGGVASGCQAAPGGAAPAGGAAAWGVLAAVALRARRSRSR